MLIGSEEGSLQMWNIKTCSMVHEFKGWKSPIHCCVSSPALDTVAIGCGNGKVYIHNLRYDETVVEFLHTSRGPITALSFRTGKTNVSFLALRLDASTGVICTLRTRTTFCNDRLSN